MQLTTTQVRLAAGAIVLLVLVLGYVLWTRSAPPAPEPPANQTLKNPLGGQNTIPADQMAHIQNMRNRALGMPGPSSGAPVPGAR